MGHATSLTFQICQSDKGGWRGVFWIA
ncbi:unnamed protein product [Linum tenue]|uniref:Uncharacterized protein n=1 Tax=Linum tenue TaxID=586396 RepID=A0AAV0QWV0_9ROSI|nr:unnamed protein product [Linum tenue]